MPEKTVEETVLYCHDPAHGHDKEYRVRVVEEHDFVVARVGGPVARTYYTVTAEWGRRNALVGRQVKYMGPDRYVARETVRKLVAEKTLKGYQHAEDIDPLAWLVGDAESQEARS